MRIEFLDKHDTHRGSGGVAQPRTDSGLFWWTILITILVGLATFCWFFSIYVFAHPEKPLNYRLLTKLDKIEKVKDFSPTNVPGGKIEPSKDLYGKFYRFSPAHLKVKNDILKRNFIGNYSDEAPLYITGNFEVLSTRVLSEKDPVTSGCVIRGRCTDFPNVDIEYIVPSLSVESIPYGVGDTFKVTGSGHYASIVHIDRFAEENICFSAIPILYPEFSNTPAEGEEALKVAMKAPEALNMESTWPFTTDATEGSGVAGLQ